MNRIKELRKENDLTLRELSEKVGISFGALGNYENERREPRLKTWQKLADFFNVSVAYLQGATAIKETPEQFYATPNFKDIQAKAVNNQLTDKDDQTQAVKFYLASKAVQSIETLNEINNIIEPAKIDRLKEYPNMSVAAATVNAITWLLDAVYRTGGKNKNGEIVTPTELKELMLDVQKMAVKLLYGNTDGFKSIEDDNEKNADNQTAADN